MHLQEVETLTGGQMTGADVVFNSVSIDTRTLLPGDLFVAISGPNFDGNEFVDTAAAGKAVAAIVSRPVSSTLPTVSVADTRKALGQLGGHNRRMSKACVLALTGSQGKTTVKEMLASILGIHARVLVTRGNLNNELGVPLTLLQISAEHEFAVVEMGANAPGEIAYTTGLVLPDIAHITNASGTHLEGFGSVEGVARAKGEIWQGLGQDGTAIINIDDPFAASWSEQIQSRKIVNISAAGNVDAHYSVSAVKLSGAGGSSFRLQTPQGTQTIRLALLGMHNIANALAAAAMALEAGATLDDVSRGLARVQPVEGRLKMKRGLNNCRVIDDSYNASPASFRAAIDVLKSFPGRAILVAGDMGELGAEAEKAHHELGLYAAMQGIDHLYACGSLSAITAKSFGMNAVHESSLQLLADKLKEQLQQDVTVLIK
ncbi:MAG: UDP-N-acetylmuramoyl-tripeptide--D-alanyl-D-alanine ligase, partial [Pseudohongiellaceae bacterium]